MSTTAVAPARMIDSDAWYVLSPNGNPIKVPAELYAALADFASGRHTGKITVEMKSGSVCGIEFSRRVK